MPLTIQLFPAGCRESAVPGFGCLLTAGQRFMTDLLVSSLMADGGLESALTAALHKEMRAVEDAKVGRGGGWQEALADPGVLQGQTLNAFHHFFLDKMFKFYGLFDISVSFCV
jgi:hypothetical protein